MSDLRRGEHMKTIWNDFSAELRDGEAVVAAVFGEWQGEGWQGFVPESMQGKPLTIDEAKPLMEGWHVDEEYGYAQCHPVVLWTNQRVIWLTIYDGSVGIDYAPRDPAPFMPSLSGGG